MDSAAVEITLDLYKVYVWMDPNGRFANLGLTDDPNDVYGSNDPFIFEYYANDVRHALEQFIDDGNLLDPGLNIERIEVKRA